MVYYSGAKLIDSAAKKVALRCMHASSNINECVFPMTRFLNSDSLFCEMGWLNNTKQWTGSLSFLPHTCRKGPMGSARHIRCKQAGEGRQTFKLATVCSIPSAQNPVLK